MKNEILLAQFVLPSDQAPNDLYKKIDPPEREEAVIPAQIKTVREIKEPVREIYTQEQPILPLSEETTTTSNNNLWIYAGLSIGLMLILIGLAIYIKRKKNFEIK